MYLRQSVSRRRFMGGAATALGYFGLKPSGELWAESLRESTEPVVQDALAEYVAFAKISFNENPDGPSDRAMDAMNMAFKYSMRYGHPDGNIQGKIADSEVDVLQTRAPGFTVTGFRLELSGYCATCVPEGGPGPLPA